MTGYGPARSQALTQGVAPTPGAAPSSSCAARPVEDNANGFRSSASLLTLQAYDDVEEAHDRADDEVMIVSVSGQSRHPPNCDLDGVRAPSAVPAQKDGKPLVVFKVSHKVTWLTRLLDLLVCRLFTSVGFTGSK